MRKIYPQDLTVKQIRYLILEKRRHVRHARLEHFHHTGRVLPVLGELNAIEESGNGSPERTKRRSQTPLFRTWPDRFLLPLEILTILGLISIVTSGWVTLDNLNQTVAASFQQTTVVATPMIQAVVLPGASASALAIVIQSPYPNSCRGIGHSHPDSRHWRRCTCGAG